MLNVPESADLLLLSAVVLIFEGKSVLSPNFPSQTERGCRYKYVITSATLKVQDWEAEL